MKLEMVVIVMAISTSMAVPKKAYNVTSFKPNSLPTKIPASITTHKTYERRQKLSMFPKSEVKFTVTTETSKPSTTAVYLAKRKPVVKKIYQDASTEKQEKVVPYVHDVTRAPLLKSRKFVVSPPTVYKIKNVNLDTRDRLMKFHMRRDFLATKQENMQSAESKEDTLTETTKLDTTESTTPSQEPSREKKSFPLLAKKTEDGKMQPSDNVTSDRPKRGSNQKLSGIDVTSKPIEKNDEDSEFIYLKDNSHNVGVNNVEDVTSFTSLEDTTEVIAEEMMNSRHTRQIGNNIYKNIDEEENISTTISSDKNSGKTGREWRLANDLTYKNVNE